MFRKTVAKPKKIDTFFTPTKRTRVAKQATKHNPNIIRLPELNEYIEKKTENPNVDYYGDFFFHRTDKEALEGILVSGHLEKRLGEFTLDMLPDLLNEDNVPPELLDRYRKFSGWDGEDYDSSGNEFDWDELQEIVEEMKVNHPKNYADLIYGREGVYVEITPYAWSGDAEGWDVILVIDNRDESFAQYASYDELTPDSIVINKDIPLDRLSIITFDRKENKATSIIPLKSRIGD